MSLKKNSLANFAGQIYTTLIGIVMLPFYLEFLGAEAYGLVGFFTLLQSWLVLLTAGLTPALARQVAYFRGRGELGGRSFREMLRSFELIVWLLGGVTLLVIWFASDWIAAHWLSVKNLELHTVAYCIALMGVMVGLRWAVGIYVSGISGLERQVWLNGFYITLATLRYGLAYVLLRWVTQDITHYFEFQLVLSALELLLVARKFYACQPAGASRHDPGLRFSFAAIRPVLPFALGISYTSALWVFMTQSDKLILSHVLSLAEYGYLAVVAVIANAVLRFSEPINQAVLPRLTMLHSQGNSMALLELYRTVTQYLAIIVFSAAGMVAMFSQPLLFALTGHQAAAEWGAPVLFWFALGNGILVIVGMQYALQFAHGQVRMHVINTSINAAVQVPIMAYVAYVHGAVAVAIAWFAIRLTTFCIWPAIVHRKFAPGLHWKWVTQDVLPPLLGAAMGLLVVKQIIDTMPMLLATRLHIFAVLAMSGLLVMFCSAMAASKGREAIGRLMGGIRSAVVRL
jgi:O-antigen/teichoic acid export membrane protein